MTQAYPPRERGVSLRARLTLWVVLAFLVIQATGALVFVLYQHAVIDRHFNGRVTEAARTAAASLASRTTPARDDDLRALAVEAREQLAESVQLTVYTPDGAVVASNRRPAPELASFPALPPGAETAVGFRPPPAGQDAARGAARVASARVRGSDGRDYILGLASGDVHAELMLSLLNRVMVVVLPVSLAAAGLAGWIIAGLAVRPIRRIAERVESLTPETVAVPITPSSPAREVASLERELEAARRRLAAGFAAHERFVANISHELKTPIATLLTESQTIRMTHASPEVDAFVRTVQDEMKRFGRMLDSFLLLTRLRAGGGAVTMRPHSVNELVMESVARCKAAAHKHRAVLDPVLLEHEEADTRVAGDPELLGTMLDNLIRNAIRFSPEGGRVDVTIRKSSPEGVTIRVRDRGPGIPQDVLARLFERPARDHDGQERFRSHGLGLRISLSVAELHGGAIRAENLPPPGGCEFIVELPVHSAQAPRLAPARTRGL